MAAAGYSGTPLLKKLGIKEGMPLKIINPPNDYFALLEQDISAQLAGKKIPQLVHLFAASQQIFEEEMKLLEPVWKQHTDLIIWVSWYKKSAGINTDLTEDIIRKYAVAHGLVDVKVCAVSSEWSGLKLVVPVKFRSL